MKLPRKILLLDFFILVFALGLTGCTMIIKPPSTAFTAYPQGEKFNLRIGLVITDELKKAQIEHKALDGSLFVIPLGQNLSMNAEQMTRTLFTEVKVADQPADFKGSVVDAILTPKFEHGDYMNVAGIIGIKLEWTLTDLNGTPVWAGTASGDGTRKSAFMYNPEDTVKAAVECVFSNSYSILSTAQEIRQFAPSK
jgi:hypothetical protein